MGDAAATQTPTHARWLSVLVDHAAASACPAPATYRRVETTTATGAEASPLVLM